MFSFYTFHSFVFIDFYVRPVFLLFVDVFAFYCCKKTETANSCVNLNLFKIHMPICIFSSIYFWICQTFLSSFAMWTWIIRKSICKMVAAKFDGITVFVTAHKCLISLCAFLFFTVTFCAADHFLCRHSFRIVVEPNQLITRERDKNMCFLAATECIITCVLGCAWLQAVGPCEIYCRHWIMMIVERVE